MTPSAPTGRAVSGTPIVLGAVIGFITAAFGIAVFAGTGWVPFGARPEIVEGVTVAVGERGETMAVRTPEGEEIEYAIGQAQWRDAAEAAEDDPWEVGEAPDGAPTCVRPGAAGQPVRVGVVPVRPTRNTPGGPVVAWVECLEGR